MLSEEAIRIMREKLEVLLEVQIRNIGKAFMDGSRSSKIIDLQIEAAETKAQIDVISKILEEV